MEPITNCYELFKPEGLPVQREEWDLGTWILAMETGGLSTRRAAAQVSIIPSTTLKNQDSIKLLKRDGSTRTVSFSSDTRSSSVNSNNHHDSEDCSSSRSSSSTSRQQDKVMSNQQLLHLSYKTERKIKIALNGLREQRLQDELTNPNRNGENLTDWDSLQREIKSIEEDQQLVKDQLRKLKLSSSSSNSSCSGSRPSRMSQRAELEKCIQLADENFDEFFHRLNIIAAQAQFCNCCIDQMMATRIAMGVRDLDLRKDLLELSPFPSTQQVVNICRAQEEIGILMNQPPCTQCGQKKHYRRGCPAIGLLCNLCKNYGHYFIMCPLNTKFGKYSQSSDGTVLVKRRRSRHPSRSNYL